MVSPILNPNLIDIAFTIKSMDIRHMNENKRPETHRLHLDLNDIGIISIIMGIEHMNVDYRQNHIGQIRGIIMHLIMHALYVTSLDI